MLQIAHDVAPGAKLCFATAFNGLLSFADNIRRLADKNGKCGADVVVDDVGYFEEPFFSDSALSDAIDEVAAKGTHYFTSAGNDGVAQSWNSKVRLLDAERGVRGTNIDLTGVDPALYDGGLQDMNPGRGTDIAQDIALGDGGLLNVQWDDPFDVDGATIGQPLFTGTGEVTAADPEPTLTFNATAADRRQDGDLPHRRDPLRLDRPDPDGHGAGRHRDRLDRHRLLSRAAGCEADPGGALRDHHLRVRRRHRRLHCGGPSGHLPVGGDDRLQPVDLRRRRQLPRGRSPTSTRSADGRRRSPASTRSPTCRRSSWSSPGRGPDPWVRPGCST